MPPGAAADVGQNAGASVGSARRERSVLPGLHCQGRALTLAMALWPAWRPGATNSRIRFSLFKDEMTRFTAKRLGTKPIIHPGLAQTIGTNINGPSAIRVPDWLKAPLGRYYLYFADHRGDHIRLAHSDRIAGPWQVHEPGALRLEDSGFPTRSSELDPPERLRESVATGDLRPHIASPDVHVDQARRQIVMHYHGLEIDCTQTTRRAVSGNGLEFRDPQPTGADFYARVFEWQGVTYAATLAGWLYRSPDSGQTFTGRTRLGDPATRHVAVFPFGDQLFLVFSRIGDAPERLLISRVLTTGSWRSWRLSDPRELLRAETPWEGAGQPVSPSHTGPADEPVNQLRDPHVLSEGNHLWLFYACAGESGLALAQLNRSGSDRE